MARTAAPAEQHALTTISLALAGLAATQTPGAAVTTLLLAAVAHYAILALAAAALRLNLPHLLDGHHRQLRATTALMLLGAAHGLRVVATAILWALTTTAHAITPTNRPPTASHPRR
ncbi:hypothetical protein AB0D10_05195 [Kitasatospora sp. NPDC048545]|uniref:hypothetical protein n=1 Tax=Kitasatospora sp. NPDC048545 TaxID=3157208 RepID=UPI0033D994C6